MSSFIRVEISIFGDRTKASYSPDQMQFLRMSLSYKQCQSGWIRDTPSFPLWKQRLRLTPRTRLLLHFLLLCGTLNSTLPQVYRHFLLNQ